MKLANPQTFRYEHPNFGSVDVSLDSDANSGAILHLRAVASNGSTGSAQLEFQDNGTVKLRVDEGAGNLFYTEVV